MSDIILLTRHPKFRPAMPEAPDPRDLIGLQRPEQGPGDIVMDALSRMWGERESDGHDPDFKPAA